MKSPRNIVLLLLAVFCLIACSDDDDGGSVLYRMDEYGQCYSPAELNGKVVYMPSMKPEKIKVVNVDGEFNPKDSFEVLLDSAAESRSYFVGSRDFEYPYLKLVAVFPLGEKSKMEIPQYTHLHEGTNSINLQIYGALISGRIENLVLKEKLSFYDAKQKAYAELEKELGMYLGSVTYDDFHDRDKYAGPGLYDLKPYVLCRHEISDSLFYSDFNELRESFAKDGTISASIKARAADAWLATFKTPSDTTDRELFKSETRDTSSVLKSLDTAFFNWAYNLDGDWTEKKPIKISNQYSEFDGRSFYFEDLGYSGPYYNGWRLLSSLEVILGTCKYIWRDYLEHEGNSYLCNYDSFVWEKLDEVDSILKYKYAPCARDPYAAYGVVGYLNEKMYACDCKESGCEWSEIKSDYKPSVLDTPSVNILATLRYGDCREHHGEKYLMDSIMVRCHYDRWLMVDSMSYYMGICHNNSNEPQYGQMPNGDYYKCRIFGGTEWERTTALEALRVPCNWENSSSYKEYEGRYYYCQGEKWYEVPKDSAVKSIKN